MAKNGEKWRWRICLFHLSNSPFRHCPPPPPPPPPPPGRFQGQIFDFVLFRFSDFSRFSRSPGNLATDPPTTTISALTSPHTAPTCTQPSLAHFNCQTVPTSLHLAPAPTALRCPYLTSNSPQWSSCSPIKAPTSPCISPQTFKQFKLVLIQPQQAHTSPQTVPIGPHSAPKQPPLTQPILKQFPLVLIQPPHSPHYLPGLPSSSSY